MRDEPTQEELVAALGGDPDASNAVVAWILQASKPMVYIRLVRYPDRAVEAEDLIQQVCLDVLGALPRMRRLNAQSMRGLISKVVERRVRDLVRRSRQSKEMVNLSELHRIDSISYGGGRLLGTLGNDRSPSSSAGQRDAITRLLDLLGASREIDRHLLILIFWDGLSTAEAAERMQRNRTAVANHLRRVLNQLRAAWRT